MRPAAYHGLPRLWGDGRSRHAVLQRRRFVAIAADIPLRTTLLRFESWRVARLAVEADGAARALAEEMVKQGGVYFPASLDVRAWRRLRDGDDA